MSYNFIYSPSLSAYELSKEHPFKPIRLELTRSLLYHLGALSEANELSPKPISEKHLLGLHDEAYVKLVKAVSKGENLVEAYSFGLGTGDNPIFPDMHEVIMQVCSATWTAVEVVASGKAKRALNLSGGLHHAHAAQASGFCLYNDLALAIDHAVNAYGLRVAYIDIDVHHGDGVQDLFYQSDKVMTLSLHESGRYLFPGTGHTYEIGKKSGRGLSVNVPLEPYTDDEAYLEAFDAVVPKALRWFLPDLIVLQAGADAHYYDPLAHLRLSIQAMTKVYKRISDLSDELCEGRLVATGGGGYDPYRTVPRAWAQLWAVLSRQDLPKALPEAWLHEWQSKSTVQLPRYFDDNRASWSELRQHEQLVSHNRAVIKRLLQTIEPVWLSAERIS